MAKYLVISYDDDQDQCFYDAVEADDECGAIEKTNPLRAYAMPVCTFTADGLRKMANDLEAGEPEKCRICGAP